jgi:hypothetical protein
MGKKKTKEETAEYAKATLAEVTKEMAKPRVAKSARRYRRVFRNEGLVVKNTDLQYASAP